MLLAFIGGLVIGTAFGVVIMALCIVSGNSRRDDE